MKESDREWNFESPAGIADREDGLVAVLKKIRYDLTSAQQKLSDAMRMVATLDIADAGEKTPCPKCGVKLAGPRTLAEHDYHSHDGPEPAHWLELDGKVEEAA